MGTRWQAVEDGRWLLEEEMEEEEGGGGRGGGCHGDEGSSMLGPPLSLSLSMCVPFRWESRVGGGMEGGGEEGSTTCCYWTWHSDPASAAGAL